MMLPVKKLSLAILFCIIAGTGWNAYANEDDAYFQKLKTLAEQGGAKDQTKLGEYYQIQKNDHKTAVKWYKLAAEQGHALAQVHLGEMYHGGKNGVPLNYKAAVKWYRLAAEQGFGYGQSNLGMMYEGGHGVPKDYIYAHMWYNIGETVGGEQGIGLRDYIAESMTPAQIKKAQKLAKECVKKEYKGC